MLISKTKQSGFSMIEVLISILVIGFGLLSLSGLQISSMKSTNNAHSRNIANRLGMELGDRMRANPEGVAGGFYNNDVDCVTHETQCRKTTSCSPEQIARADVQEIMCGVRRSSTGKAREGGAALLLPNGSLDVSCVGGCAQILAEHNISLTWSTAKLESRQDDADLTQAITVPVTP